MAITLTPAQRAVAIAVLSVDRVNFENTGVSAAEWALDWLLLSALEKRARFVALLDQRKTDDANAILQLDAQKTAKTNQLTTEQNLIDQIEATI